MFCLGLRSEWLREKKVIDPRKLWLKLREKKGQSSSFSHVRPRVHIKYGIIMTVMYPVSHYIDIVIMMA